MAKKYSMATADRMIEQGGSFVQHIARAYFSADATNAKKLEETFKDYFESYQKQEEDEYCACGHEMTDGNYGGVCKDCR